MIAAELCEGRHHDSVALGAGMVLVLGTLGLAQAAVPSLTAEIKSTIRCTADGLAAERTGRPPAQYLAEVEDVFFVAGQPRTRRIFVRDAGGKVVGFVDRREGEDVRWTRTP
jgi:hypothetical protein